jgi:hypothetical protein
LAGDGHPNAKGEVKCAACQQLKYFRHVTNQNPQYQGLICTACLAWQEKCDDCGHGLEVEEKYEHPKSDKSGVGGYAACAGASSTSLEFIGNLTPTANPL